MTRTSRIGADQFAHRGSRERTVRLAVTVGTSLSLRRRLGPTARRLAEAFVSCSGKMDRTRASDSERERVVEALGEAAVAGRLTVEELDARSARAYAAVTRGELAALLEDLPGDLAHEVLPDMSTTGAESRPAVPKHLWPGPSPWMAGDLRFYVRWLSRSDVHEVGVGITRTVVPVLRQSGYAVVQQAADELVLRRAASVPASIAAQRGFVRQAEVRIVIVDQGDHTITEAYGVAPQLARQAIAQLAS